MKKQYFSVALLLLATLIWGTSFSITNKILNDNTSPITLMMYRSLFSFILLLPIFIKKIIKLKMRFIDIKYGVILGIIIFIGFVFQTFGASYTTPSKNAFLTTLYVIFVPFILFIFHKQKVSIVTCISAFVALIGAYIMSGFSLDSIQKAEQLGDILTIISAIFWAIQIIKTGEYAKKVDIWILMFFEFFTMFILSFVSLFLFKQSLYVSPVSFIRISYLAIFCSVICFGLMSYGMKFTTPEKTSLIFTFEGVFGALFSFIFLIEPISKTTIVGGVIIFFALVISETKLGFLFK